MIIRIVVDIVHNFDYLHIIRPGLAFYITQVRPIGWDLSRICLDQSPSFSEISNIFLIGLMAFFCTSSSTNISGISNFKQLYSFSIVFKRMKLHSLQALSTVVRRSRDEFLIRTLLAHLVNNATFRRYNELFRIGLNGMLQQSRGRSYEVWDLYNRLLAFRMGDHFRVRVLFSSKIRSSPMRIAHARGKHHPKATYYVPWCYWYNYLSYDPGRKSSVYLPGSSPRSGGRSWK